MSAEEDEIKRAFRSEVKRLHPDTGARTRSETDRLDALIAAYERYKEELAAPPEDETDPWGEDWSDVDQDERHQPSRTDGHRDPARNPAEPAPWFTPPQRGPEPRPGFWS